jgi:hypothetical protein
LDASADVMNGERNTDEGDVLAATGVLWVIGYPGSFTAWGLELIRQILETNGHVVRIMPLDGTPDDPNTADAIRVLFGYGPAAAHTRIEPSQTIAFLDAPAWSLHELILSGCDPVEAARRLTATLAPLAAVLRRDGALLIRRTPNMDPVATQSAIANHISGLLDRPLPAVTPCPPIDVPEPVPPLGGQARALLRQTVNPLENFVTDSTRDPIVWPLASFHAIDHPNEIAPPFIEVVGPARFLYFGPYFYLPQGRWRADVKIIVSGNMHDKKLAVDVFAGVELVRHEFNPAQGGLLQASLPFVVDRPEASIEVRTTLLEGAIEGFVGLKQVLIQPTER